MVLKLVPAADKEADEIKLDALKLLEEIARLIHETGCVGLSIAMVSPDGSTFTKSSATTDDTALTMAIQDMAFSHMYQRQITATPA